MKVSIFNQSSRFTISRKKISDFVENVLQEEKFELDNLNIIITDDNYLKKLNKMYFRKNRRTNVISFNLNDVSEIYVSYEKIEDIEVLYYYIIHGLLHIIGYDHKNKMEKKLMEEKCFKYLEYASADDDDPKV